MTGVRIASPERRVRAIVAVLAAGWFAWSAFARSTSVAETIVGCVLATSLLGMAVLIMRSHLVIADDGLTDCRMIRVIRVRWEQVTEFGVERPGGLWGGFCVVVYRKDGTSVDLLSTRAYSRAPSERHLDELHRICWTLEEAARTRRDGVG